MSFPRKRESAGEQIRMSKTYCVYILANDRPTLYIGVTNDLMRRIYQHKNQAVEGFSKKYMLNKLVYFEFCSNIESAITREKQLKRWNREWKLELIKQSNPDLKDLYDTVLSC